MRFAALCAAAPLALSCVTAEGATVVPAGDTLDFTFGVASGAGAIGVSTVTLTFDPGQPQLLVNPGGYGFFGNLRFDYFEIDRGGGDYTVSIIITTGSPQGFVPAGLTIGGQPVDTMFFDFGDYFSAGAFSDGIDLASGYALESANFGYFIDGALAAGPFGVTGLEGGDLVGQAGISTNNGSDIGVFGINGFRIDWNLTSSVILVPLPAGAMLGLSGLGVVATRRRR